MTILIRDMEMPSACDECQLCDDDAMCLALGIDLLGDGEELEHFWYLPEGYKSEKCPLIEVPTPHGDLIDREELLNDAGGVYTARPEEAQKIQHEINKVLVAIQDAPTVIEAEGE